LWLNCLKVNYSGISLTKIEKAVDGLSPEKLGKLAADVTRHDNLAWDKQLGEDFFGTEDTRKALRQVAAQSNVEKLTSRP